MRRRRAILLSALLLAVALVGLTWLMVESGPPDPIYNGRPLSYWLEIYYPTNWPNPQQKQADEALRQAGTNAIPLLLSFIEANDPPWKIKMLALLSKQHVIKIKHTPPMYRNYAGAYGIRMLGTNAVAAVPALIDLHERNISRDSQLYTKFALAEIGPPAKDAIPILIKGLTNSDLILRMVSLQALGQIHSEITTVLPILTNALSDPSADVRSYAIGALGDFGADAKPAVPALLKLLTTDPDTRVQSALRENLKKIDKEAAAREGVQ